MDNITENDRTLQEHGIAMEGRVTTVNPMPKSGETRDCTDPWHQPFIQSGGQVWPCCWYIEDSVGNLKDKSFAEIWNDEPVKTLRRQLLTGDLNKHCLNCPSRGLTSPDKLLERVRNLTPSTVNQIRRMTPEQRMALIKANEQPA